MKIENLSTLKIHKLTEAQYNREHAAGNIDENALYLVPDNGIDIDEIPNLYVWKKYSTEPYTKTEVTEQDISLRISTSSKLLVTYSDGVHIENGTVSLNNKKKYAPTMLGSHNEIKGKYIEYKNDIYFIPNTATISYGTTYTVNIGDRYYCRADVAYKITVNTSASLLGYVGSTNVADYPTDGQHTNGYWYLYHGQTSERLVTGVNSVYYEPSITSGTKIGTFTIDGVSNDLYYDDVQTSDAREKENILPIGTVMYDDKDVHTTLFDSLKPVQFNFIKNPNRIHYGLIAQDVATSMKTLGISENDLDLVHHNYSIDEETGKEKDMYGISYINLIPLLIHEVQKLKSKIEEKN